MVKLAKQFGLSDVGLRKTCVKYGIRNAQLRQNGEKRTLKLFPSDPTISWDDWKKRPDVFAG